MSNRPLVHGRAQILVGDTTSHGGVVVSGSPNVTVNGIPVARVGDMVTCPRCKPHIFPIVEGLGQVTANNIPVALHGHKIACGATLIAAASGATAPAPDASNKNIQSGLGESADQLIAKSPTLIKDLDYIRAHDFKIRFGPAGQGSSMNRSTRTILLDSNLKNNPRNLVQVLAHEVGHAMHRPKNDVSSRQSYLNDVLDDEGAATMKNLQIQREILTNGGPNIGIAGNQANHADYSRIYDEFLKNGDKAKAIRELGQIVGQKEITSTTGENYIKYYGGWYDKHYGK